ncbi:MAG: prolyl oligopeptidase family serine peptidase [Bdellovibrionota bacterium]
MTTATIEEKFGKWKSWLEPKHIAQKSVGFADLQVDCDKIYWTESRPGEQGRTCIVSYHQNNLVTDETPNVYHVSTGVHGYGGGAFLVKDGIIYFVDAITNQVFKKEQAVFSQITNKNGYSYADFSVDKTHTYLYCLRLEKRAENKFPTTQIVRIEIQSSRQEILFTGADFYSNVRINLDGTKLLYLQWNYPNMPWDENELWTADIDSDFNITNNNKNFHTPKVSLYQPEWQENEIYCSVDINNYWNICKINENLCQTLFEYPAEFARPLWIANTRTFAFISEHEMLATCCEKGVWKTFLLDVKNNSQILVQNNLTCISNMAANSKFIAYIAGNSVLELNIFISSTENKNNIFCPRPKLSIIENNVSIPKIIEFKSNNKTVYAFYYPPKNSTHQAPINEKPPCILKIHGGPTSNVDFMFNSKIQFYTSRGFAYVELNYSGSSGHGREYRERLNNKWGIVDVEDCLACAEYLCTAGLADKNKLILSGSSAGGFTLLNTLTKSNLFKCASCHYGVADLTELANHIHKFEACYDQNLIGDTIQNNPKLYIERSPINHAHNIQNPIIFFHGDKDSVVHMSQTIQMVEALKKQNIYYEVTIFEGEGHGFKKEETIISVLEKELAFFQKHI